MRAEDWNYLHGREKWLAKPWSRLLKVQTKTIVFNEKFAGFLAVMLSRVSADAVNIMLATLKQGLHADDTHADDSEKFREDLPGGLRQILELPFDRFPHPELFAHDCGKHVKGSTEADESVDNDEGPDLKDPVNPTVVSLEGDPGDDVTPKSGPATLAGTLDSLELLRDEVRGQVETLLDELSAGRRPSREWGDLLSAWHRLWDAIPSQVNTLTEVRALIEEEAARTSELAADEALVAEVTRLRFPAGNEHAFARIAEVQGSVAAADLPLDESERAAFAALLRVLRAELPDDGDAQTVTDWFGMQVLMAATRLTPEPDDAGEHRESGESEPTEPVDDGTVDVPAASDSPEQTETAAAPAGVAATPSAETDMPEPAALNIDPGDLEQTVSPEPAAAEAAPAVEHDHKVEHDHEEEPREEPAAAEPTRPDSPDQTPTVTEEPEPIAADTPLAPEPPVYGSATDGAYLPRFDNAAARGDFASAYWYAVAGDDDVRAQAARLLVLATSSEMAAGSPHPRANEIAAQLGGDLDEVSAALGETVAAALVPAALMLPPYSEATLSLNTAAARLGDDCPAFIHIANKLTYERGSGLHTLEAPLLLAARDQARADLVDFRDRAPSRTMRFHRATEVWRELIRQQGLLGALAGHALDNPGDTRVRDDLAAIDERAIARIIKNTDQQLNPMQAKRQAIIAGAKQELSTNIQRYIDLVRTYVAAEESVRAIDLGTSHTTDLIEELIAALSVESGTDPGLGCVAVGVAHWLRDRLVSDEEQDSLTSERDLLARPLANAYELDRDANGDFDPKTVTVALLDAAQLRSVEEAFDGYVARHDFVGLAVLLDAVRAATPGALDGFKERERRAKAESRETLLRALEHTRIGLARALSVTSLSDAESQEYQDMVERVARDTDPHFPVALATLARIDEELASRHQKRLDDAVVRLAGLTEVDDAARKRVADLIEARDLLSAEEFLAQLSNGATSLPEEDPQDRTLEEFWAVAEDAAASAPGMNWFGERLKAGRVGGRPLPHPSAPQRTQDGLAAWNQLSQRVRPQGWDGMLNTILNAIGFRQVKLGQRFSPGRVSTSNVFEADYDGYALTPTFGSAARGQYALYLCWERKTVDGLLQAVRSAQETQARPTVVLYFQTLKPAERRQLAEQSRRKGLPNIVLDHAAMAYLGTREETGLDGLMHTCLPFTGANPYTPFVLGDVPREMFYGRREELKAVQDPNDSLFVYGGRQLGKSALLKTAMSEFGRIDEQHVSIYLDLKAEGIGEWHHADDLWRVLLPHLQASGVAGEKVSKQAPSDVVARQISDWLAEDQRRHLLLLLDESDAFLDQDAQPRNAGKGQFKNVYMLKNLMNQSERRFKPVFAGLHQVQRFHKESNGPMAHVGAEIQVGPLPPAEAYKLVVRPLEAIGYRFTSPDVVWRLLSHTNYQASLIQLFCQELVNDLRSRRLALAEPPSLIDGATVDRVYENRELRGQIAQRFDWTIQLDNRYRVIALVAAWLNLTDSEAVVPVAALRAQCSDFWSVGFEGVSPDEFRALLDEMVGLGVLVRSRSDQYGIRSPNVIRLLGSKEEIERKLMESAALELPTVFDPARYRRRLADNSRSPLTEAQAARLLSHASDVTLVVASPALGADRLNASLTEIASSGDGVELFPTTPDELTATLTSVLRMRRARHVFLDARGIHVHDFGPALAKLGEAARKQGRFTASVLLDPGDRVRLDLPEAGVRELTLEPWTDIELRAVEPEADVPLDADVRSDLLDLTGGWPDVLEPVLAHARRKDATTMLDLAKREAQKVIDRGWDAFAAQIGVTRDGVEEHVLTTLLEWGEPVGRDDLADLLVNWEPERLTGALDALTRSGAVQPVGGAAPQAGLMFVVNPLVARTIKQGQ